MSSSASRALSASAFTMLYHAAGATADRVTMRLIPRQVFVIFRVGTPPAAISRSASK